MKISGCSHAGCRENALALSDFCWDHQRDKNSYAEALVKALNGSLDLAGANLKKVCIRSAHIEKACIANANMSQSDFSGTGFFDCNLEGSEMVGANLAGCDLTHCDLKRADLTKASLADARLWSSDLTGANLTECDLSRADMWNAKLYKVKLWHAVLDGARSITGMSFAPESRVFQNAMIDESGVNSAEESYRDIKRYFLNSGMYNDVGWASFKEKSMERILLKKRGDWHYLPSLVMNVLCGYGEKPYRIVLSALLTILAFAALYFSFDAVKYSGDSNYILKWYDYLYYSTITFTTVGYGDFIPKAQMACKLLATMEAFSGVFMTGLFIFTLARKYSAR